MRNDVNENGRRIGEGHPRARYSDSLADMVFSLKEAKVSSETVSKLLDLPASTVRSMANGQARRQMPDVFERK